MSPAFHDYLQSLDELRALRERGEVREQESPILEAMDECWEEMTEAERSDASEQSWRAWSDQVTPAGGVREDALAPSRPSAAMRARTRVRFAFQAADA